MRRLFERGAGREAEIFAEAQALLDDGLDLPFVLDLFAEDADWLEPMLQLTEQTRAAAAAQEPSYFFETSLKSQFLAAGAKLAREERAERILPMAASASAPGPFARLRTWAAATGAAVTAAALGVLTFGFVTADTAVPGDWNYSLKLAQERLEYALSRGDDRVDVQLRQTESRVYELQAQLAEGKVSESSLDRLQREARELAELASKYKLDEVQKARLRTIGETSTIILSDVSEKRVALQPKARDTIETVNNAVAAGTGSPVTPLTPTAHTPTATATTPTEEPVDTETPAATESPTPTPEETPQPTEEPAPDPAESPTEVEGQSTVDPTEVAGQSTGTVEPVDPTGSPTP